MKLNNVITEVSKNGILAENQFSIVASSKAFKILSSNLYKNKILAVIRELSCNAYDAHVANGNADRPFDIHLPTKLDLSFKIRDYGTGLCKEDVLELYTSYFNSTKTESNDYIGALGLGSKSPFSYTDSFIVTSYYNNVQSIYSAYLDSDGMPKISLLTEIPTSADNGLQIEFSVKESDIYDFKENYVIALKHFKVKPNLTSNVSINFPNEAEVLFECENWKILNFSLKGPIVIQGNIEYPISFDSIKSLPGKLKYLSNIGIVINVELGEIDIAASREELSYDEMTSNSLIKYLNDVNDYFIKKLKLEFDNTKSKWDAYCLYNEYKNHYIYKFVLAQNSFISNDISINSLIPLTVNIDKDADYELSYYSKNRYSYSKFTHKKFKSDFIRISNKIRFYIKDVKSKQNILINHHMKQLGLTSIENIAYLISIKDVSKVDEYVDIISKKFHNVEIVKLSDIIINNPQSGTKKEIKKYCITKYVSKTTADNVIYLRHIEEYLTKEELKNLSIKYYVKVKHSIVEDKNISSIDIIKNLLTRGNILVQSDNLIEFYVINGTLNNIVNLSNSTNIIDYMYETVKSHSGYDEYMKFKEIIFSNEYKILKSIFVEKPEISDINNDFSEIDDPILRENLISINQHSLYKFKSKYYNNFNYINEFLRFKIGSKNNITENLLEKYRLLYSYNFNYSTYEDYVEYVNLKYQSMNKD